MKLYFGDILERIKDSPKWFDTYGVPRYDFFHPKLATIYGDEVVLFVVACQGCGEQFNVALASGLLDRYAGRSFAQAITEKKLFYGDPPNTGCCHGGPTMTVETIKVLEYWVRSVQTQEWKRISELEDE